MMTDKTLDDLKVDAHIAVLHTKVDSLIEKQKELTARVRANERVVAIAVSYTHLTLPTNREV